MQRPTEKGFNQQRFQERKLNYKKQWFAPRTKNPGSTLLQTVRYRTAFSSLAPRAAGLGGAGPLLRAAVLQDGQEAALSPGAPRPGVRLEGDGAS